MTAYGKLITALVVATAVYLVVIAFGMFSPPPTNAQLQQAHNVPCVAFGYSVTATTVHVCDEIKSNGGQP